MSVIVHRHTLALPSSGLCVINDPAPILTPLPTLYCQTMAFDLTLPYDIDIANPGTTQHLAGGTAASGKPFTVSVGGNTSYSVIGRVLTYGGLVWVGITTPIISAGRHTIVVVQKSRYNTITQRRIYLDGVLDEAAHVWQVTGLNTGYGNYQYHVGRRTGTETPCDIQIHRCTIYSSEWGDASALIFHEGGSPAGYVVPCPFV